MTLVIYAIAGCEPGEIEGVGLDGARLEAVGERRLTAVVSRQARADDAPSVERLWRYERVIEGLMERHAILPARYGSRFADRHEVGSFLRDRHDDLAMALERVASAVELSIHGRWREIGTAGLPQTGTDYMRERVQAHRRVAALTRRLGPLASVARASRVRPLSQPAVGVQGAYLVESQRVGEFAALVSELAAGVAGVDLICTGPWPPYTFAEAPDR